MSWSTRAKDRSNFVDEENERYITVTEDRLQVHARSESELEVAMAAVEAHCTSAVMYLAKTLEERGVKLCQEVKVVRSDAGHRSVNASYGDLKERKRH